MKGYSTDARKTSLQFLCMIQINVTEIQKYNTIHTFTNMSPHIRQKDFSVNQKTLEGCWRQSGEHKKYNVSSIYLQNCFCVVYSW